MEFKDIHIGKLIKEKVLEDKVDITKICKNLKCSANDVSKMYESESIDISVLLKWSKLLEYDFFRIYTQHLILYSPPFSSGYKKPENGNLTLPKFRKNIYTKELIEFIIEMVETGTKSKKDIIEDYRIPKTTLYKWLSKYNMDKISDSKNPVK